MFSCRNKKKTEKKKKHLNKRLVCFLEQIGTCASFSCGIQSLYFTSDILITENLLFLEDFAPVP